MTPSKSWALMNRDDPRRRTNKIVFMAFVVGGKASAN
jgi:hypothetical protein